MKKKELIKNPSDIAITPSKKTSKWNFITRLFKRSPKVSKTSKKKSKSKDSKRENPSQSGVESIKKSDDFASFLQNCPSTPKNQGKTNKNDDSPPLTSSNRLNKDNSNPLSKIFENGALSTPDKKFLKKFTGMIDIKELDQKENDYDMTRPKKPLDSARNKIGGLKYRNNVEKFQKNLDRKFVFTYREKSLGEIIFNINFFKEILTYFSMESLLNFSATSKRFHSNDYHYKGVIHNQMMFLVTKGLQRNTSIHKDEQYIFWNSFIHFDFLEKSKFKEKYFSYISKNSHFEREICMDLDRTFPDLEFFRDKTNKQYLHNVLKAISNSYTEIGYIQGINAWVGVLLLNGLKEIDAYWLIIFFLNKMNLKSMISPGFPKIKILNYQLEIYMKIHMKDVINRLNSIGLDVSYFATQWFITLFAYDIPMNALLMIWNLFLLKGFKILIRIAIALISLIKNEIITCEEDYLSQFLKNFVKDYFDNNFFNKENVIKEAKSFKVTNRLLRRLEILYTTSENPPNELILQKNAVSFKNDWRIVIPSVKNESNYLKRGSIKQLDD